MTTLAYLYRRLLFAIPLILGVTLVSFLLMVYFGPDQTYTLLGKNPTPEDIAAVRARLGYDLPLMQRYIGFLKELVTFDFGLSSASDESVAAILKRTFPVTILSVLPGFLLGNGFAIALGIIAANARGTLLDRLLSQLSAIGMSVSILVMIIGLQWLLCSSDGLGVFPIQGWDASSLAAYLHYGTVPTLTMALVTMGYNMRYCRALLVAEMSAPYVKVALARGGRRLSVVGKHVLRNAAVPLTGRVVFSLPLLAVGGSLLIETFFGIPGLGSISYDAIVTGDLPVLKAIVSLSALLYIGVAILADVLYKLIDPRIGLAAEDDG